MLRYLPRAEHATLFTERPFSFEYRLHDRPQPMRLRRTFDLDNSVPVASLTVPFAVRSAMGGIALSESDPIEVGEFRC